jgi:hypothetical protein
MQWRATNDGEVCSRRPLHFYFGHAMYARHSFYSSTFAFLAVLQSQDSQVRLTKT